MVPHILTQIEEICKKINIFKIIYLDFLTEGDFQVFFSASIWSRRPGPTLVPGVFEWMNDFKFLVCQIF